MHVIFRIFSPLCCQTALSDGGTEAVIYAFFEVARPDSFDKNSNFPRIFSRLTHLNAFIYKILNDNISKLSWKTRKKLYVFIHNLKIICIQCCVQHWVLNEAAWSVCVRVCDERLGGGTECVHALP